MSNLEIGVIVGNAWYLTASRRQRFRLASAICELAPLARGSWRAAEYLRFSVGGSRAVMIARDAEGPDANAADFWGEHAPYAEDPEFLLGFGVAFAALARLR